MSRSNRSFRSPSNYARVLGCLLMLTAAPLVRTHGAAVTLTGSDGYGQSSFNSAGNWDSAAAPAAGNDYFTGNHTLRTPHLTTADYVFAGDSLTINSSGSLGFKTRGTITVSNLILAGGTLNQSSVETTPNIATLAGGITLADGTTSTFNVTDARTIQVDSTISGSGNVRVTGGGTGAVVFSATNNYTGNTIVDAGTLRVNSPASLPAAGTTTINAPGTLNLLSGGTNTFSNAFAGDGRILLTFSGGNANTYLNGNSSSFTGTLELAGSGGNKLNTSGLNISSSAAFKINSGAQLFLSGGSNLANPIEAVGTGNTENRGAIRLQPGTLSGTVTLVGNTTIGPEGGNITGNITSGAAGTQVLTLGTTNSTGNSTYSGVIGGGTGTIAVRVLNSNSGHTIIPGSSLNTYTGGTTLLHHANGTRLRIDGITGTPYGSGPITIGLAPTDRAGIFFTTAGQTLANDLVFNTARGTDRAGIRSDQQDITLSGTVTANLAPATFSTNGTGSFRLTGQVTGPSGLVLDNQFGSSISVTLANTTGNPNNYQGNTVLAGAKGTLNLGAAEQIPHGPGAGNLVNHGTLNMNGFSETINGLSGTGTVRGNSGTPVLTVGAGNASSVFGGTLQDAGGTLSLTKVGAGALTFAKAQTYSGATTVVEGTLQLAPGAPLPGALYWLDAADAATMTQSGGAVSQWGDKTGNNRHFAQGNAGQQPQYVPGAINGLAAVQFDAAAHPNSDRLVMSESTTPRTVFLLNQMVGSPRGLAGIWGRAGGDFGIRWNGTNGWLGDMNTNDWSSPAGSESYIDGAPGGYATPGTLHLLTQIRAPSTELAGTAIGDYWGSTHNRSYGGYIGEVIAYDYALSAAERQYVEAYLLAKWTTGGGTPGLPADTALSIAAGATFALNGWNQTIGSLSDHAGGGGSVLLGSGTLTVGNAASTTFSGSIAGTGGLTKTGAGTLTLAGPSTYTGPTNVNAGTLMVNGALGNTAVAVNSGATLGGTGSIGGTVTINAGGTHAPGASVGSQTVGSETWMPSGRFEFEINDADGVPGGPIGWDELLVDGTLDLTNLSAQDPFHIDIVSLSGAAPGDIDNFVATVPYEWPFLRYETLAGDFSADLFSLNTSGFSNPTGRGHFEIVQMDYEGADWLAIGYVPEPSALVLLLLGLAALGLRRRRR